MGPNRKSKRRESGSGRQSASNRWYTALPGSVVAGTVALLLLGGSFGYSLGALHITMLLAVLGAAALRIALPPGGSGRLVELTRQSDLVILPLAAIYISGAALGTDATLVFPLTLLVLVWSAAALERRSLTIALGYAVACEVFGFIGRGAWSGNIPELLAHLAFIGAFAGGGAILLRHEVETARRHVSHALGERDESDHERAEALGLTGTVDPSGPGVDIKARVDALGMTFNRALALARRAVRANTALVLMREVDDSYKLMEAATTETDILLHAPIPANEGMVAAVLRQERTAEDPEPVLRISPLEGSTANLPYYTSTPARIKSTMAVPLRREDGTIDGILWFDRTAGEGFDERDAEYARRAAALLSRILDTERTVFSTAKRSELLDYIAEATRALASAFEPAETYRAVVDAAARIVPLRFAALVVRDGVGDALRVVYADGEGADGLMGTHLAPGASLARLVMKTPAIVPRDFVWTPAHGELVGGGTGPKLADGDAAVAIPLTASAETMGALILVARRPYDASTITMLELLAHQAAVSVRHAEVLAELQARATTDGLTGLDNRITAHKRLQESLARADRAQSHASVLLMDLDYFKQINDTHGHQAGDLVLRRVAGVLQESKRINDSTGRFGGEEFLMVLESTGEEGARLVAERIRQKVASLSFEGAEGPFQTSISIGVAVAPRDGTRADDVLKRADKALYQAKHAGRNRVRVYGDATPTPALAQAADASL